MYKRYIRTVITLILVLAFIVPQCTTKANAAYENTYENTGNMRDDIIGVALTQVGYEEGENNYTKYGVWYDMPNAPWCGIFVSWCANEAGIPTSVLKRTGVANPENFGLSYQSGNDYTPQKGDLFFKEGFTHVGLVYYTEGEYFYTVEGNTSTTSYDGTSVMIRKRLISDFYFSSPNYSGSSNSGGCTHDYEIKIEVDHPHKEYKICSKCQNKTYTGNTETNSSCSTCTQESCTHTFSQWKSAGESKHEHSCTKCGLTETKNHTWKDGKVLKEATCLEEGSLQKICTDCGAESTQVIETIEAHIFTDFSYIDEVNHQKVCSSCGEQIISKHTLGDNWQFNNLYHWTSCADCGGHIRQLEHRFTNGCTEPCTDCGYITRGGHNATNDIIYDADHHWQLCVTCNQKVNIKRHVYSSECDEFCNECNYRRSSTAAHTDTYLADATGHWSKCSQCNRETDSVTHSPCQNTQEWESLLCVHCGYELRSAAQHVHQYYSVNSDNHSHWGTCQCGHVMESQVHTWNIQTGTCSICGMQNAATQDKSSDNFFVRLWNQLWK